MVLKTPSRTSPLFVALAIAGCSGLLSRDVRITAAERAGLVVTAESISHPTLGFSIPTPRGTFSLQPDIQRALEGKNRRHPETVVWWLVDADRDNLTLDVTRFSKMNEEIFRAHVRSYQRMSAAADTIFADSASWTNRGEYRLALRARGIVVMLRCLSRSDTDHLIVCIQTSSKDSAGIDHITMGFSLKE